MMCISYECHNSIGKVFKCLQQTLLYHIGPTFKPRRNDSLVLSYKYADHDFFSFLYNKKT